MKWIQWAIDNAWTLIIVGTVVAQMLQAIFKKRGGGEADGAEPPKEFEFEDPELAERTRRIREEIQRKIEQRARGEAEPPPLVPVPAPPPVVHESIERRASPAPAAVSSAESRRHAELLEQQAVWEEKLREAERMKAAIQKRTAFESLTTDHSGAAMGGVRGSVVGELRDPEALRRAFVLREVLGPPVALR